MTVNQIRHYCQQQQQQGSELLLMLLLTLARQGASARGLCVHRYLDLMWSDVRAFAANCGHIQYNSWIGDDCVSICWLALPCSCRQDYGIYKHLATATGHAVHVVLLRWFWPPHRYSVRQKPCWTSAATLPIPLAATCKALLVRRDVANADVMLSSGMCEIA